MNEVTKIEQTQNKHASAELGYEKIIVTEPIQNKKKLMMTGGIYLVLLILTLFGDHTYHRIGCYLNVNNIYWNYFVPLIVLIIIIGLIFRFSPKDRYVQSLSVIMSHVLLLIVTLINFAIFVLDHQNLSQGYVIFAILLIVFIGSMIIMHKIGILENYRMIFFKILESSEKNLHQGIQKVRVISNEHNCICLRLRRTIVLDDGTQINSYYD